MVEPLVLVNPLPNATVFRSAQGDIFLDWRNNEDGIAAVFTKDHILLSCNVPAFHHVLGLLLSREAVPSSCAPRLFGITAKGAVSRSVDLRQVENGMAGDTSACRSLTMEPAPEKEARQSWDPPSHKLAQIARISTGFAPLLTEVLEDYIEQNAGSGASYRIRRLKAANRILGTGGVVKAAGSSSPTNRSVMSESWPEMTLSLEFTSDNSLTIGRTTTK
jgi:hypothetical protein